MARRQELEKQVAELQARVEALGAQLETYRAREGAIVEALTQAQDAASRRLEDAAMQAQKQLQDAQKQSETLLQDAREKAEQEHIKAAAIVEAAQQEAERRLLKADEAKQALDEKLDSLNAALFETASEAAKEAERFSLFMESLQHQKQQLKEQQEQYETPRALMQGIYQLQGRDAPYESLSHHIDDMPSPEHLEEPSSEQSAQVQIKEEEPAAAPKEAQIEHAPSDERLWTVDEVMEGIKDENKKDKVLEADDELDLDSLLDEILSE